MDNLSKIVIDNKCMGKIRLNKNFKKMFATRKGTLMFDYHGTTLAFCKEGKTYYVFDDKTKKEALDVVKEITEYNKK